MAWKEFITSDKTREDDAEFAVALFDSAMYDSAEQADKENALQILGSYCYTPDMLDIVKETVSTINACTGKALMMVFRPAYICKFCGADSFIDPHEQTPPPNYCHESDHGL